MTKTASGDVSDQQDDKTVDIAGAAAPPDLTAEMAQKTVSQVLGEIVWLLSQSPAHRLFFMADLEWAVMPALLHNQYRIFYGGEGAARRPIGVALWAFVSAEVEARLKAGHKRLQPAEWKGGDRPMLIELIAPFGLQEKMIENLARSVFKGKGFGLARQATERGAPSANGSAGEK